MVSDSSLYYLESSFVCSYACFFCVSILFSVCLFYTFVFISLRFTLSSAFWQLVLPLFLFLSSSYLQSFFFTCHLSRMITTHETSTLTATTATTIINNNNKTNRNIFNVRLQFNLYIYYYYYLLCTWCDILCHFFKLFCYYNAIQNLFEFDLSIKKFYTQ